MYAIRRYDGDWDGVSGSVYYSPSPGAMLGYDEGERPQGVSAWMERIHPGDREAVVAANTDCIENRCESFLISYNFV